MNRRNFLTAALTTTAAGLLIPKDTPGVEEFAATEGESVALARSLSDRWRPIYADTFVYNKEGQPIGIVKEINSYSEPMDMTMAGASHRHLIPGITHTEMTVVVQGILTTVVGRDGRRYHHIVQG